MKQKTRKTNVKRGGAFVGHGAYGCGFRPSLRCKGEVEQPSKNIFSKLMLRSYAQKELQLTEDIRIVDPSMQFTIYPASECPIEPENIQIHEANIRGCPPIAKLAKNATKSIAEQLKEKNLVLLRSPAAQMDFFEFAIRFGKLKDPNKFLILPDLFRAMRNLFVGLVAFHSGPLRFYHMDIKMENIVLDFEGDIPVKCRFIDFGLSTSSNKIQLCGINSVLTNYSNTLPTQPFELAFAGLPSIIRNNLSSTYIAQHIKKFYDLSQLQVALPYDGYYSHSRKTARLDYNSFKALMFQMDSITEENKHIFLEWADLYGLARTFHNIITHLCNIEFRLNQPYQHNSTMLVPDLKNDVHMTNFLTTLQYLLIRMTYPVDLSKRILSQEALEEYDKCLKYLE